MVQSVNGLVDTLVAGISEINKNKQMIWDLTQQSLDIEKDLVRQAIKEGAVDFLMLNKSAITKIQRYSKRVS
jgi:hypothetical protein